MRKANRLAFILPQVSGVSKVLTVGPLLPAISGRLISSFILRATFGALTIGGRNPPPQDVLTCDAGIQIFEGHHGSGNGALMSKVFEPLKNYKRIVVRRGGGKQFTSLANLTGRKMKCEMQNERFAESRFGALRYSDSKCARFQTWKHRRSFI